MEPNKDTGVPGDSNNHPSAEVDQFNSVQASVQPMQTPQINPAQSPDSNPSLPTSQPTTFSPSNPFSQSSPENKTIVGNFEPDMPPVKNSKKKKLLIAGGAALAITLAAVGFVFGYYVPNQPENVYRTGLDRSGEAIHELILQSTETEKLQQIKKSEFEGALQITSDFGNIDGSFNAKLDPTKTNSSFDVTFKEKDSPEQKYGLKLLTQLQDGKRFPNVYFQLSGLKSAGLDAFVPGLSDYDNKWIAVEAEYLESLGEGFLPPEEKENKENVSAEEVAELIRVVSETSNDYLFTSNPDKAVLENREYVGKEKTAEGISAYRYKVGINAENAIEYCKTVSDRVLSTRAAKKFMDADDKELEEQKKSAAKDCDESKESIKADETFDMWVDAKYKVIHKFRIYDEQGKTDKYTDIGQIYTGGDKLAFFTLYHDDKDNLNVKFTLDVDTKALSSKAKFTASQEGDSKFNGNGSISAKPYDGEVNAEKPAGAVSIEEILKKFGYDPTYQSGISSDGSVPSGIQSKANDSEIKSDLQAIASQVEVYFADNAHYPSLAQMNSKNFRDEKLFGISEEALIPPGSTNKTLASSPSKTQYAYSPTSCDSSGRCQKFVLSGLLSTGEIHKTIGSNN